MNRNLIYVYMENLNDCFVEQGINFVSDFQVDFDIKISQLSITNRPSKKIDYFETENNVQSIELIVGKNGSGKTTILDLLGSTHSNRINLLSSSKSKRWFSVYHVNENIFVIEGNEIELIKNIINCPEEIDESYSIVIELKKGNIYFLKFIQEFEGENEKVQILYNAFYPNENWYTDKKNRETQSSYESNVQYARAMLTDPLMEDIYYEINDAIQNNENSFSAKNIEVIIQKREFIIDELLISGVDKKNDIDKQIKNINLYQNSEELLITQIKSDLKLFNKNYVEYEWSLKERFIIEFFEETVLYQILEESPSDEVKKESINEINKIEINNIYSYGERVHYLLEVLKTILQSNDRNSKGYRKSDKPYKLHNEYIRLLGLLQRVNPEYFKDDKIVFPINEYTFQDFGLNFMKFVDQTENIRTFYPLKLQFSKLSSGELQFIKHFSTISKALRFVKVNSKIENIIIFLDEPDSNFHPEWSRKYINTLVKRLNSVKLTNVKFQIFITTHSPFMISDIPKQYITCIDIKETFNESENSRTILKADFGLMSNFYDLIKNNFFIKHPVGEYASNYFNETIKLIENLSEEDYFETENHSEYSIQIAEIDKRINLIDDEIIRSKLAMYLAENIKKSNPNRQLLIKEKEEITKKLREINRELGIEYDQFKR